MEVGTLLLMLGLAYAAGVLWYDLLPGRLPQQPWRAAAYPFLGIFVAQALLPKVYEDDPTFGGIYLVAAVVGSLVAVLVDWLVTEFRQPALVSRVEPRIEPQAA